MEKLPMFRFSYTIAVDVQVTLEDLYPVVISSPGYDRRRVVAHWSDDRSSIGIFAVGPSPRQVGRIEVVSFPHHYHYDQLHFENVVEDYDLNDIFEPKNIIVFDCNPLPALELQAILTSIVESRLYSDCLVEISDKILLVFRRGYGWLDNWMYPFLDIGIGKVRLE